MDGLYYNPYIELYHHGIKGQKWGVRRYQNSDGTYTSEGKKRHAQSMMQNYKLKSVRRSMGKIDSIDKKAGKANTALTKARQKENDAKRAYEKAQLDNQKALNRLYKHTGSLSYKLGLTSAYAEQKLQNKVRKSEENVNVASEKYSSAKTKADSKQAAYDKLSGKKEKLELKLARQSRRYINRYGSENFYAALEKSNYKERYEQPFINKYIDDTISVMSGDMTRYEFNHKYRGTGVRIS